MEIIENNQERPEKVTLEVTFAEMITLCALVGAATETTLEEACEHCLIDFPEVDKNMGFYPVLNSFARKYKVKE
jgi:hypothetical protein